MGWHPIAKQSLLPGLTFFGLLEHVFLRLVSNRLHLTNKGLTIISLTPCFNWYAQ